MGQRGADSNSRFNRVFNWATMYHKVCLDVVSCCMQTGPRIRRHPFGWISIRASESLRPITRIHGVGLLLRIKRYFIRIRWNSLILISSRIIAKPPRPLSVVLTRFTSSLCGKCTRHSAYCFCATDTANPLGANVSFAISFWIIYLFLSFSFLFVFKCFSIARNVYKVRMMEFGFVSFVKVFSTSESIFITDNFDYLKAGIVENVRK